MRKISLDKVKSVPGAGNAEGSVNQLQMSHRMSVRAQNLALSARNSIMMKKKQALLGIVGTPLSSSELRQAQDLWEVLIRDSFASSVADVHNMLLALRIPVQPLMDRMVDEAFSAAGKRFSFRNFAQLLEQCKTVHAKWLHKLRGKSLDDDLLEAFVAVGGQSDSNGNVDIAKMRSVVNEFNLKVDIDRIVTEMDNDGGGDIDFGEFASLIRDNAGQASSDSGKRKKGKGGMRSILDDDGPGDGGPDDIAALDDFLCIDGLDGGVGDKAASGMTMPITLSSRLYMDEDADRDLLFPTDNKPMSNQNTSRRVTAGGGLLLEGSLRPKKKIAGEVTPSTGDLKPQGSIAEDQQNNMLPPIAGGRTKLYRPPAPRVSGDGGGVASSQAFYKGGGGLRNMTPSPTRGSSSRQHRVDSPQRSHTSLQKKPQKVHKFLNT